MTYEEMREIVRSITYKPGWAINFYQEPTEQRPYVQLYVTETVAARDSRTGHHVPWKSAKRYLSRHMCRQEIVGAVFGLIRDAEEHETREWFRYRGASIYNPHLDPEALWEVARKADSFNVRENAMESL